MRRICILTAGHLSTCPRMVKAADALSELYDVRVISAQFLRWATDSDRSLLHAARWRPTIVAYDHHKGLRRINTALRQRVHRAAVDWLGPSRLPLSVSARALSRIHDELVAAAVAERAEFYYAGTNGALAAAAEAASRAGVPYGLDLEDFHSGETRDPLMNAIAIRVESAVLGTAAMLTAGSDAIANAYATRYGVTPVAVPNTFPLPVVAPDFERVDKSCLVAYWFGQTVGLDRGIQDAIIALGRAGIRARLEVRGNAADPVIHALTTLAGREAPLLTLSFVPPGDATEMVRLCRGHDVGFALEVPCCDNRPLTLGNKTLVYPLAGLAVCLTDTPGHREFASSLGQGALLCCPGDVDRLAAGLKRWADDDSLLRNAKRSAWNAAAAIWNWERTGKPALLDAVSAVLM